MREKANSTNGILLAGLCCTFFAAMGSIIDFAPMVYIGVAGLLVMAVLGLWFLKA